MTTPPPHPRHRPTPHLDRALPEHQCDDDFQRDYHARLNTPPTYGSWSRYDHEAD